MDICCEQPFTQFNGRANVENCLNCNKSWKTITELFYTCPHCNEGEQITNKTVNKIHQGRTGWTQCKNCQVLIYPERRQKIIIV